MRLLLMSGKIDMFGTTNLITNLLIDKLLLASTFPP